MSCAACSTRVEKAVSKVPGVTSCSVSLLTNSMGVEGTASPHDIINAVEQAGYGASLKGANKEQVSISEAEEALEDHETPILKRRLIASVGFLLVLMYFSMGHMMWGWPLPAWFNDNHIAMGLVQLLLAGIIMVINQKFFISGFKSLWHRAPNMDTLVALGSMASFVWSVYALFAMTRAQVDGDSAAVMNYMMDFYFESAAMILTLTTLLSTSSTAYAMQDYAQASTAEQGANDPNGPFNIAVAASNSTTGAKVVWVNCANLLNSKGIEYVAREYASLLIGGNAQLLTSTVNWMTGEENGVVIDSKSMSAETLTVPAKATMLLGLLFTIVVPLAFIVAGIAITLVRRRR